jgi:hypothetical protein
MPSCVSEHFIVGLAQPLPCQLIEGGQDNGNKNISSIKKT